MYRESQKLSTRAIARSLISDLTVIDQEIDLGQFLLWPPDLFALTSRILSITGAYTNVIAPPNNKYWPPKDMNLPTTIQEGRDSKWVELIPLIGQSWRQALEKIPLENKSFEEFFKTFAAVNDEQKMEEIKRIKTNILPPTLLYFWEEFTSTLSPEKQGDVEVLICMFDNCPNSPEVCKSGMNTCEYCPIWKTFEALMSLHAIADEACVGWGIRTPSTVVLQYIQEEGKTKAQQYAEMLLERNGSLANINNVRGRVLPKRHTPSIGITLRSLSANLAFHFSSVSVNWKVCFEQRNQLIDRFSKSYKDNQSGRRMSNDSSLSILLFPWPFEIKPTDFITVDNENINIDNKTFGFFTYHPTEERMESFELEKNIRQAILAAKKETSSIDLVILPESSLDAVQLKQFEKVLIEQGVPSYLIGKREENIQEADVGEENIQEENVGEENEKRKIKKNAFYENIVLFRMAKQSQDGTYFFDEAGEIKQNKHHRWNLGNSQIVKYNLGHILSPNKHWWEAINIKRRIVNFINIGEEITLCPLICEDLARQDPIADLIRTVGPSLVVTILMDGPQKMERWSAKYASVLAEDPGCAVITLTSFGMVKRSQQHHGRRSNSIALVNDCKGNAMEIEMDDDSKGVLLNLCLTPEYEALADGRTELGYTNNLTVGAIHQLK